MAGKIERAFQVHHSVFWCVVAGDAMPGPKELQAFLDVSFCNPLVLVNGKKRANPEDWLNESFPVDSFMEYDVVSGYEHQEIARVAAKLAKAREAAKKLGLWYLRRDYEEFVADPSIVAWLPTCTRRSNEFMLWENRWLLGDELEKWRSCLAEQRLVRLNIEKSFGFVAFGKYVWRVPRDWAIRDPVEIQKAIQARCVIDEKQAKRHENIIAKRDEAPLFESNRVTREKREAVMRRGLGKCEDCGSTEEPQIDHVEPRSVGGSSNLENLVQRCRPCNGEKGDSL